MNATLRLFATGGFLAAAFLSFGAPAAHANEAAAATPEAATTLSKEDVRKILKALLLEEPELVIEAINAYQEQEEQRRAEQIAKALPQFLTEIEKLVSAGERVLIQGDPNGDVTVIEFADYDCPWCRRLQPQLRTFLEGDPKIRHVVKALSFIGSPFPESAIVAAAKQGDDAKVAEFHNAMMAAESGLSNEAVLALAAQVGLDAEKIKQDVGQPDVQARLERNKQIARLLQIQGTPALIFPDRITSFIKSDEMAEIVAEIRAAR